MSSRHCFRRPALLALLLGASFVFPAFSTRALAQETVPEEFFQGLRWQNVGPERGGRSIAVAGSDARPMEFYFGATGGGLWKTTDGGTTWRVITDGKINSSSVGAVAVCEADPDVVYIGMGETELRGNVMQGDGVYKSTDGGTTWSHVGLARTQNISRVRVHPSNCNTVWVGAFGVHSMANPERGVYKTTDGGENWDEGALPGRAIGSRGSLPRSQQPEYSLRGPLGGVEEILGDVLGRPGKRIVPQHGRRVKHGRRLRRNPGMPQEGVIGKIGVAVSPADQSGFTPSWRTRREGVFRSDDGGDTWTRTNDERKLRQRAFYYSRIYADPVDKDRVYVLNTAFFRSDDGGKSFGSNHRSSPRGQPRSLDRRLDDPERMINANDGGANVSFNGGQTWTAQDFPTGQFYRVAATAHQPYMVCGAQQDNYTACVAPRGWSFLSSYGEPFYSVGWVRERIRGAQAVGPRHLLRRLLRREPDPVRPFRRPDPGRERLAGESHGAVGDRPPGEGPVDLPHRLLPPGSECPLYGHPESLEDHQRGAELGGDQPGPDHGPNPAPWARPVAPSPRTRQGWRPTRRSSPSPRPTTTPT